MRKIIISGELIVYKWNTYMYTLMLVKVNYRRNHDTTYYKS